VGQIHKLGKNVVKLAVELLDTDKCKQQWTPTPFWRATNTA